MVSARTYSFYLLLFFGSLLCSAYSYNDHADVQEQLITQSVQPSASSTRAPRSTYTPLPTKTPSPTSTVPVFPLSNELMLPEETSDAELEGLEPVWLDADFRRFALVDRSGEIKFIAYRGSAEQAWYLRHSMGFEIFADRSIRTWDAKNLRFIDPETPSLPFEIIEAIEKNGVDSIQESQEGGIKLLNSPSDLLAIYDPSAKIWHLPPPQPWDLTRPEVLRITKDNARYEQAQDNAGRIVFDHKGLEFFIPIDTADFLPIDVEGGIVQEATVDVAFFPPSKPENIEQLPLVKLEDETGRLVAWYDIRTETWAPRFENIAVREVDLAPPSWITDDEGFIYEYDRTSVLLSENNREITRQYVLFLGHIERFFKEYRGEGGYWLWLAVTYGNGDDIAHVLLSTERNREVGGIRDIWIRSQNDGYEPTLGIWPLGPPPLASEEELTRIVKVGSTIELHLSKKYPDEYQAGFHTLLLEGRGYGGIMSQTMV